MDETASKEINSHFDLTNPPQTIVAEEGQTKPAIKKRRKKRS
jgi:hypothetical protein